MFKDNENSDTHGKKRQTKPKDNSVVIKKEYEYNNESDDFKDDEKDELLNASDAEKDNDVVDFNLSESSINELKQGFKNIVTMKKLHKESISQAKTDYQKGLDNMQNCLKEAGLSHAQALKSKELFYIWGDSQSFTSIEKFMYDVIKENNENKRVPKGKDHMSNYMYNMFYTLLLYIYVILYYQIVDQIMSSKRLSWNN